MIWLRAGTLHTALWELEGPPSRWYYHWYAGGRCYCLYQPGGARGFGSYGLVRPPELPLSQALVAHTVQAQLGCSADVVRLFRDSLRVCRTCLSRGYHCILHQLAGCARCVVDGGDLQSVCPRCREPLGEFAPRNMDEAFRCRRCGASWLRPADHVPRLTHAQYSHVQVQLDPLIRWLRHVDPLLPAHSGPPFWPNAGEWLDETAVTAIALTARGAPPRLRRSMSPLPASLRVVPEDLTSVEWLCSYSDSGLSRRLEHLQRLRVLTEGRLLASLGGHQQCVQAMAGHVRVTHVSDGQRVFLDTQGCALGQAWWLFRLHFECALRGQGRGWYTYDDPAGASEALAARMESFFHACFLAVRVCIGTVRAPAEVRHAFAERFLMLGNVDWLVDERPNGANGTRQSRLLYVDPEQIRAYRHRRARTTGRAT